MRCPDGQSRQPGSSINSRSRTRGGNQMAQPNARRRYLSVVPPPGSLLPSEHLSTREAMQALSPQVQQPRDVSRMLAEARKQILSIEIAKTKTVVAQSAIGDL